ncbi:MAG: ABC transporter permease [Bacteroidales bacterium]|jgi:putative ABC transport system permease protein|nr:ABC transporter permease [Bacteroidales bacterium]
MNIRKLVWLEFKQHKSQLISGLLAIVLGIAVIVGIRSISVVSEKAVAVNLDNLGANIMVLPQASNVDNYYSADIDAPTMPEEYVDRIISSNLAGVDNLSPKLTRRIKIGNENVVLTGILPINEITSKPMWQQSGLLGNNLMASCAPDNAANKSNGYEDEKLQRKVIESLGNGECLIGSSIAKKLNVKDGNELEILGQKFIAARVLNETGTVDDDRVFIHLHRAQELLKIPAQVSAIEIMGCCNAISDGLLGKLRNVLPDTRITTIGQIVSTQIETNKMMNKVSMIFLIIIIFVGGISIGNFMWANINERRKEIGMLRMVGFNKTVIYRMMLSKAFILGIIGGIIGYILGTLAGVWLGPELAGLPVKPIASLIGISLAISIGVSLLGALIPSYLAGKIEPFKNMQEI